MEARHASLETPGTRGPSTPPSVSRQPLQDTDPVRPASSAERAPRETELDSLPDAGPEHASPSLPRSASALESELGSELASSQASLSSDGSLLPDSDRSSESDASDAESELASEDSAADPAELEADDDLADYDADAHEAQHLANTERFRVTLEDIMRRYDQPFDDDGDEIDIHTLEVVTDRGFLRRLGTASFGTPVSAEPPDDTDADADAAGAVDRPASPAPAPAPAPEAVRPTATAAPRTPPRPDALWIDSCTPDEEYALETVRRRPRPPKRPALPAGYFEGAASSSSPSPSKAARVDAVPRTPPSATNSSAAAAVEQSPCDGPAGCRRLFCLSCGGAFGR